MLRRQPVLLDTIKDAYHRINLPRRLELAQFIRRQHVKKTTNAKKGNAAAAASGENAKVEDGNHHYKYNRWMVNNEHAFVHQQAFIEDPAVIRDRRTNLTSLAANVTKEDLWKKPMMTTFLPFEPFIKVVDYAKDPDAKNLKPINIPRWKSFMTRSTPTVPRTWY